MNPLWRRFASSRTPKDTQMQTPEIDREAETDDEFDPEFDAIVAERDAAQAELAKMREQFLREHAELENTRKRLARDVEQSRKFANERLLGSLLPVFDSLEAGIAAVKDQPLPVREGLELTLRQLLKVASDNGMAVVDPMGHVFNPEHHQAIAVVPAGEQHPPDTVMQVHQKGYLLNERLLRPALVIVAKGEHD